MARVPPKSTPKPPVVKMKCGGKAKMAKGGKCPECGKMKCSC